MLTALIPALTELATGYLSNRKEKAVAKQKLAVAKIEAQVTKVQSDATWEEKAIDSSVNSLKDEAWTHLLWLRPGRFHSITVPVFSNCWRAA